MRRALVLLAALALGAAPLTAHATTAPTLTLTQQARKADVIVRATLGTPTNVTEGETTWVTYPLTVTETVAGDPATLPQREGRPVLYVLSGLEDLPELRAGQEAFLLLYSRRMDNPIVGFAQGVYPVVNGRVTRPGEAAGTNAGTGASTASSSAATPTTTGTGTATSTASGTPTSATGTATAPTAPGSATSTTAPGSSATTTAPGMSTSGTAAATAPGTTASTTTPGTGATSPTAGNATTPGAATGTTPSTASPGASAASPNPAAGGTPTTSPASGATSPTAANPPVNDPNAFPSDPARFRDALRAAREGR